MPAPAEKVESLYGVVPDFRFSKVLATAIMDWETQKTDWSLFQVPADSNDSYWHRYRLAGTITAVTGVQPEISDVVTRIERQREDDGGSVIDLVYGIENAYHFRHHMRPHPTGRQVLNGLVAVEFIPRELLDEEQQLILESALSHMQSEYAGAPPTLHLHGQSVSAS